MLIAARLVRGSLHRLRGIASFAAAGTPPFIPPIPETVQAYGYSWRDDYNWMQSHPREIERILRQEAEYFRHVANDLSSIAALSSQLRGEIQDLLPHQTSSVGEMIEGWEYISEQSRKHPLPIYSRRRQRRPSVHGAGIAQHQQPEEEEKQILLDVNELEKLYGEEISIGQIKLSKCGNLVAFTIGENGVDDIYSVLVRDVLTGQIFKQPALKGVVSIEWDGDNETLLATQPDELGRPARVVSTSFYKDAEIITKRPKTQGAKETPSLSLPSKNTNLDLKVLYEEKDPRFFLELQRTKDWSYLIINSNSKTSSEVHILPTTKTEPVNKGPSKGRYEDGKRTRRSKMLTCVQPRQQGLEYFLEHLDGKLYIISNARNEQKNYDLYCVDVKLKGKDGLEHVEQDEGAMNGKFWTKIVVQTSFSSRSSNAPAAKKGNDDVFIEDLDVNHNGIVLYQRSCTTGKPEIEIIPIESLKNSSGSRRDEGGEKVVKSYRPQLPEYAWSITPGANADFNSDTLRVMVSSPVHPDQALDWNFKFNDSAVILSSSSSFQQQQQQQQWIQHDVVDEDSSIIGHTPDEYTLEKTWAPMLSSSSSLSASSVEKKAVPISLIYSKSLSKEATRHPKPCLVVVYASYGINLPTDFALERLPLLKRGWTIALVHARGGGELGRLWHAAGRGPENKPNSALGVESAVEYLINSGYTKPGSIALEATSAGAVAAGGILNNRPELFGAVVLESPFVDVLSTMIDPKLPLTVHEYEEFGDPSTEHGMKGLQQICPYQNIFKKNSGSECQEGRCRVDENRNLNKDIKDKNRGKLLYPPVLITCSSTDARVPIWGPLKYAAKLRASGGAGSKNGDSIDAVGRGSVMVYADAHGGHLPDDREKYDLKAVQYAFLIDAIKRQQQEEE